MSKEEMGLRESVAQHGRKPYQKEKPFVVLQYLLKHTDENHVATAYDIIAFLEECGIYAERRSIYRDIDEINRVMWMLENGATMEEAETAIATDEYDSEKTVVYDKSRKGFYVQQRHYDINDIRLLAECVYSAKFIVQGQADRLVNKVICGFVSEKQANTIKHDALLTDRVKTNNKSVLNNISAINEAMSKTLEGQKHEPEKISFKYLEYTIDNLDKPKEGRGGERYIVSPYRLLINDGNYYLMGYDDKYKEIRVYRVDRMADVRFTGEPREGQEAADQTEINKYSQQSFSMFGGNTERVTIRFQNRSMNTVFDRFGRKGAVYLKLDEEHFTITADIKISDQFFTWVCGFGRRAKIISPEPVVKKFEEFLDKIREMY
ncbi:WYL domain-containing protein [Pseudoflavonifractor phocaeensis]|uniref:helix-turn-helix transcriptional regulator n=1 Tax=Pseudoflavonifractor phocaeensis TaxID=1870988 RepID=UPI0025A42F67|nr:WYL domain-containing protein [Pseudoflavonifractor phocaeensis]MDM8240250.1 WYL domain-containing protein [Pseudoflavonifractor phocaeensis]